MGCLDTMSHQSSIQEKCRTLRCAKSETYMSPIKPKWAISELLDEITKIETKQAQADTVR